jgi:hypothetical protein
MRGTYEQTLGFLAQSRLLQPSTIVVAEHEKKFDLDERFGALVRHRRTIPQPSFAVLAWS